MTRFWLIIMSLIFTCICTAQVMNVRKWRQTERDSLETALALVDEQAHLLALPIFESLLSNHPKEQFLQYSYGKCALYRGDKQHESYDLLAPVYTKTKKIPDLQYDLALAAFYRQRFDESDDLLAQYLSGKRQNPEIRQHAERLQRYVANARKLLPVRGNAMLSLMGEAINTEGDESAPVITADQELLVFTYKGPRCMGGWQFEEVGDDVHCQVYRSDVWFSRRKNRRFEPARGLDSINTWAADRVCGISADGRHLLLFYDIGDRHGDIYLSSFNGIEYTEPKPLQGPVNGFYREMNACFSPDGRTLFFSSDRPGGHGGLDIYRATLSADSTWENVQNLGDSVNTALDEDMPFMSPDGEKLFFSSRGWNSMGGLDVFYSSMRRDSTFSQARNLGAPVNYTFDDNHFKLSADGKTAYFSSERKEGMGMSDIFQVQFAKSLLKPVLLVKGMVKSSGKTLASMITVERTGTGSMHYTTVYTDSVSGNYSIVLPAGKLFRITCSAQGMRTATLEVSTQVLTAFKEQRFDFDLSPVGADPQPIVSGSIPSGDVPSLSAATTTIRSKVSPTTVAWPDKDGFMPQTLLQKKAMRYMQRYGMIASPGLEFVVQFAAVKGQGNLYFPQLSRYGRISRLRLGDGYTRLIVGGKFKTLSKAFAMNKKVVNAGNTDAFVIAIYNGVRVDFEELERLMVFK